MWEIEVGLTRPYLEGGLGPLWISEGSPWAPHPICRTEREGVARERMGDLVEVENSGRLRRKVDSESDRRAPRFSLP